jgi:hypothetical protein
MSRRRGWHVDVEPAVSGNESIGGATDDDGYRK